MARTKYQQLQAAKKSHCAGRTTSANLTKKKNAYIADAVKKGRTKAEATKSANKVLKKSCGIGSTAKKRKTTAKKKTTARRRRR